MLFCCSARAMCKLYHVVSLGFKPAFALATEALPMDVSVGRAQTRLVSFLKTARLFRIEFLTSAGRSTWLDTPSTSRLPSKSLALFAGVKKMTNDLP